MPAALHIAVVAPEFPPEIGGMQTYALEFALELVARGYRVTVLTRRRASPSPLLPGIDVRQVLTGRMGSDRVELQRVVADAWHVMNAAYAWVALDRQPTVVSVHGNDFLRPYVPVGEPELGRWLGLWRSERLRPALERWIGKRRTPRLMRAGLQRATHILANSRYTERAFVERFAACQPRTSTGLVGVGAAFLQSPPPRRPRLGTAPRLITVCRLSEDRKNVGLVLAALATLHPRHAFHYTIVGDGDLRPALEHQAQALGLADRVAFTGFLPEDRVTALYAQSDLFVLTAGISIASHEGFGIAYLEANACGTPTLAARLAGAAEAVDENVSGYFVETPSVPAIALALARFLSGEVAFEPEACRAFARRFTWARVVDAALPHYAAGAGRAGGAMPTLLAVARP